jgi:hypothetical protein
MSRAGGQLGRSGRPPLRPARCPRPPPRAHAQPARPSPPHPPPTAGKEHSNHPQEARPSADHSTVLDPEFFFRGSIVQPARRSDGRRETPSRDRLRTSLNASGKALVPTFPLKPEVESSPGQDRGREHVRLLVPGPHVQHHNGHPAQIPGIRAPREDRPSTRSDLSAALQRHKHSSQRHSSQQGQGHRRRDCRGRPPQSGRDHVPERDGRHDRQRAHMQPGKCRTTPANLAVKPGIHSVHTNILKPRKHRRTHPVAAHRAYPRRDQ